MSKTIDRIFGWLLVVGSIGHATGTIMWTQPMSQIFLWSLGSALAAVLLGVLNIIRAGRPGDRTLAVVTAIGTACWMGLAVAFGVSIGNVFDPRTLYHFVVSGVLVVFGLIAIRRSYHGETADAVRRVLPA